jgi:hypothetical protein
VSGVGKRANVHHERYASTRQRGVFAEHSLNQDRALMRVGVNRVKPDEQIGTIRSRGRDEAKADASQETSGSDRQSDPARRLVEKEPDGRDERQPSRRDGTEWKRLIAGVREQNSRAAAGKQGNGDYGGW